MLVSIEFKGLTVENNVNHILSLRKPVNFHQNLIFLLFIFCYTLEIITIFIAEVSYTIA